MAKVIQTCFTCGSAWDLEAADAVKVCPYCASTILFEEPFVDDFQNRRIHVDPAAPAPDIDRYDISFHPCKQFPAHSRHGQVRWSVVPYDDAELAKKFFTEVFGWDIVNAKGASGSDPLMFAATGPGWDNWEPMFPSFSYTYLKRKKAGQKNPRIIVEVNSLSEICKAVLPYGGKVLEAPYTNEEGKLYAVLEDSEGNPFYVTQTPDNLDWNAPENQNNWDVREYPQMYRNGIKNQGTVPEYIGRRPKTFPPKDLHGRMRFGIMGYKDFKRFQKFWVDLFGWDMIELPETAGGKPQGDPHPSLLIATGPSYYDYEGLVPGHMNFMAHHAEGELPEISIMVEIHMDQPPKTTVDKIIALGGKLMGEMPEKDTWSSTFPVSDPFGNIYTLWKVPPTRTWTDPESGYEGMSEEHIDKLSLFWPKKDF